jgi:hypothetical protein
MTRKCSQFKWSYELEVGANGQGTSVITSGCRTSPDSNKNR